MARDKRFDLEFQLEDAGVKGLGEGGGLLDEVYGLGGDPDQILSENQYLLDTARNKMANWRAETGGPLGMMVKPSYSPTGFQANDGNVATLDSSNDEFSNFNYDFLRKHYHNDVDTVKYPTYSDWINSGQSKVLKSMESGDLKLHQEENGKVYIGSFDVNIPNDVDTLSNEAFIAKHKVSKDVYTNLPEYGFLKGYIPTLLKGQHTKRGIFDKKLFKKDYEYEGGSEDLSSNKGQSKKLAEAIFKEGDKPSSPKGKIEPLY